MKELFAPNADELFIAGRVDKENKVLLLWRASLNGKALVVPLDSFKSSGDGTKPDFAAFHITDGGLTLAFGDYEASSEAVLYENDAEVRRRMKKRRIAEDEGFGASLKRLRLQRGLTQEDFEPALTRRQIARLEQNLSARPRQKTLEILAKKLGVRAEEISGF